tara:strand:- start:43 stop:267 length:225 start_codon:yes stop_codon:yes gene_type:complete
MNLYLNILIFRSSPIIFCHLELVHKKYQTGELLQHLNNLLLKKLRKKLRKWRKKMRRQMNFRMPLKKIKNEKMK